MRINFCYRPGGVGNIIPGNAQGVLSLSGIYDTPTQTTTYYIRLSNFPGWLYSDGCKSITVTVLQPAIVSNVVGDGVTPSTANLSWDVSGDSPTSNWQVSIDPIWDSNVTQSGQTTGSTATATGLTQNTTYYLLVRAQNTCGTSTVVVSCSFNTVPFGPSIILEGTNNDTICLGNSVTLTAYSPSYTPHWYQNICKDQTLPNYLDQYLGKVVSPTQQTCLG